MPRIRLTNGRTTLVDADTYWWARHFRWSRQVCGKQNYARAAHGVLLHRVVANAKPGQEIDHRNRNGLDNRACNLRVLSHANNLANGGPHATNKSGYRGVSKHSCGRGWVAYMSVKGKTVYLGYYRTKIAASRAYEAARAARFE